MSKVKSRKMVEDMTYRTWVQRRAEQLALRHDPATFTELLLIRTAALGSDHYDVACRDFDHFLEGYKIEAYRAADAEMAGARWLMIQNEFKNMRK